MRYHQNKALEVQDHMVFIEHECIYATIALSYLSLVKDIDLNPNNKCYYDLPE